MRVLLIEDDVMFGKALVRGLRDNDMTVDWVRSGVDGSAALKQSEHEVVLLDIGLPDISGFNILKAARQADRSSAILIITARDCLESVVNGLDLGADDYIVKPFALPALLARMRAVLRRVSGQADSLLMSKEITLDLYTRVATFRGVSTVLTAREFSLLYALMKRPGTILSRSQIEGHLYGWGEEVQSNAVEFLIHNLRKRYGKDIISNIRGAGWMVAKESS